jgi:hypothetical protein
MEGNKKMIKIKNKKKIMMNNPNKNENIIHV